jgi:hypothetical protein
MGLDRMELDGRAADLPVGQITSSFRKPRIGYPESICQDD